MYRTAWILCFFYVFSARAALDADLKKMASSYRIPQERLGLYVVDLSRPSHPVLLSVNGEKNFVPASLTKIATAGAILEKMGPSFKFETDILSTGDRNGDTLKGSLYLRGGGDPGFVSETMWLLVNEFFRTGIKKIDGDIVVDESAFDSIRFDESREPERVDRAYDAPVGAMSFNWNSINIYVRPGTIGKTPQVILDPEMSGWKVSSHATTSKDGKPDIRVSRADDSNTIIVNGKIPSSVPELVVYKGITEPAMWSGEALRAFLLQRGISVKGSVRAGKTPTDAAVLAKMDGQPVRQLVIDMMKFSNNFVAEMLTKDLGAKFVAQPARLEDGIKVIRESLIEMGLKKENFQLVSPSGLNRHNSFRPADLTHVLIESYRSFYYSPEYLSALPLGGMDGTLKKRFKDSSVAGWVRAKTGHLQGVTGLAGYAGQREGGVMAFVFIFNGPEEQGELARRLFDALASKLVQ